jgi:putative endonuclease
MTVDTNNLFRGVYEHNNDFVKGFTKKYGVHTLVYFEQCDDYSAAIWREKQIKEWKIESIEMGNPLWQDLYSEVFKNS